MPVCSMEVKILNIAEKPSVAEFVSTVISKQQGVQTSRSCFLDVAACRSEYQCLCAAWTRGDITYTMVFTSTSDHNEETDFHYSFRRWNSCPRAFLYDAPVDKFVVKVYIKSLCSDTLIYSHISHALPMSSFIDV